MPCAIIARSPSSPLEIQPEQSTTLQFPTKAVTSHSRDHQPETVTAINQSVFYGPPLLPVKLPCSELHQATCATTVTIAMKVFLALAATLLAAAVVCVVLSPGTSSSRSKIEATELSSIAPDPGQMTAGGCECATNCHATFEDAFNCDWCQTKDNCGKHSLFRGYYDYCVYPGSPEFDQLDFKAKDDYFQQNIFEDKNRAKAYAPLRVIITESSQTSFWDYQDELPAGRIKGIHTIGAVCKFELDVRPDSPYTGLFASGPQVGWVRMGGATTWDKSGKGYPPGECIFPVG